MTRLRVNGVEYTINAAPDTPLLWVLRDELGLAGTKFGCGIGQCGACTILLNGAAVRSCQIPLSAMAGQNITTIEGLPDGDGLHFVQQAWQEIDVPQCGYCQSGQIMATVALLQDNPNPDDAQIDQALSNICRCGTYPEIRQAVHAAAKKLGGKLS